jgi:phenolic acid decarboxylase
MSEANIVGAGVYVVSLNNRYGTSISVHTTMEGAKKFIYDWVVDNWTLSAGIPNDHDQAIAEYFDLFSGESMFIYPTNVEK